MNSPLSLPIEILDDIFDIVDSTSDLLSFALVSKALFDVVVPTHLHFRYIRCNFRRSTLWRTIAAEPNVASRCHKLELSGDEDNQRIPPDLNFDEDKHIGNHLLQEQTHESKVDDCLTVLSAAIKKMRRLKSFVWRDYQRPSSVVYNALLTSCPFLAHADLWMSVEELDPQQTEMIATLADAPFRRLSNLTQFAFTTHVDIGKATLRAHIKLLSAMLLACVALEDLYILIEWLALEEQELESEMQNLFLTVQWPRLRRLTVHGFNLPDAIPPYPHLEHLYIRNNLANGVGPNSDFRSLSALKCLDLDFLPTVITDEILQGLTYLGLSCVDSDFQRLKSTLRLAANLSSLSLCYVTYTPYLLTLIAQCAPRLERLGIRWLFRQNRLELMRTNIFVWREVIELLPNLTHIGIIDLAAFSPPHDKDWANQRWVKQGLKDRLSAAVEQLYPANTVTPLRRIHFLSDITDIWAIWVFINPSTHQIEQFSVFPGPEGEPRGAFDIPWSKCYIAGLHPRSLSPIACDSSDPSKLPKWPY